jgi:hypothetical protein
LNGRIVAGNSSAGLVITGLLLGLLVGVGIGTRLAATPVATGAIPGSPILDVQPDAVSQRLRDAYYAGGGSTEVCVAAASVICNRAMTIQTGRRYDDITKTLDPTEMAALIPVHVPGGRIILAGDFGPVDGAALTRVVATAPVDGRLVVVANPERRGIDYADLGILAPGDYLFAIDVPTFRNSPTVLVEIIVD